MTLADLTLCRRYDPQSPWHLMSFATGLSVHTAWPPCIDTEAVLDRFLEDCYEKEPTNFKTIKASCMLRQNGSIDYHNQIFELKFEGKDGRLSSLKHIKSQVEATIPDNLRVFDDFDFINFWSAGDAAFRCRPSPAVKLRSLFPKAPLVFGYLLGGGSKAEKAALAKTAQRIKECFEEEVTRLGDSQRRKAEQSLAKQALDDAKKADAQAKMSEIQVRAKAAIESRAAKRVCVHGSKAA